jgi:hypothetical protein
MERHMSENQVEHPYLHARGELSVSRQRFQSLALSRLNAARTPMQLIDTVRPEATT